MYFLTCLLFLIILIKTAPFKLLKKEFFKMIKYYHKLVYILPIGLITGPFVTNSIIIICSLLFLIDTFNQKLFDIIRITFFILFLIFFLIINISALLSNNLGSLKYSFGYIRYGIFAVFIFYVLENFRNFKLNFFLFNFNFIYNNYF